MDNDNDVDDEDALSNKMEWPRSNKNNTNKKCKIVKKEAWDGWLVENKLTVVQDDPSKFVRILMR